MNGELHIVNVPTYFLLPAHILWKRWMMGAGQERSRQLKRKAIGERKANFRLVRWGEKGFSCQGGRVAGGNATPER